MHNSHLNLPEYINALLKVSNEPFEYSFKPIVISTIALSNSISQVG